jgi:hypothetical protein
MPSYVCTTSSDQTARIYVLDDSSSPEPNPFWLPGTGPSKGGAPHGLRPSEREVWGEGLCIAVLVGGRSGGHLAAVTCAAFHPAFPLIATGGVIVPISVVILLAKRWMLHPLYRWIAWSKYGAYTITTATLCVKISHCSAVPLYIDLQLRPWLGA